MVWPMIAAAGMSAAQGVLAAKAAVKTGAAETYNRYSAFLAEGIRNRAILDAANKNIAAIRKDKVTTNKLILQQEAQAEANAKVSAATAGVTGGSVADVEYQITANAGFAMGEALQAADDEEAQHKATIFGAAYNSNRPFQRAPRDNRLLATLLGAGQAAVQAGDFSGGKASKWGARESGSTSNQWRID